MKQSVLIIIFWGLVFSCEKECPQPGKETFVDTISFYDTIQILDTVPIFDTIPIYDTVFIEEPLLELHIGDEYQGGIIVYLDEEGLHGLIAAEDDLYQSGYTFSWGSEIKLIGASSESDGKANTEVMKQYAYEYSAAYLFKDFNLNGYNDWFIPAKNQLLILQSNTHLVGGFPGDSDEAKYWSSTELSIDKAYGLNMIALMGTTVSKNRGYRVRPMREF